MLKLVVLQFYNFNNDKTVSPHFVADKKKKGTCSSDFQKE